MDLRKELKEALMYEKRRNEEIKKQLEITEAAVFEAVEEFSPRSSHYETLEKVRFRVAYTIKKMEEWDTWTMETWHESFVPIAEAMLAVSLHFSHGSYIGLKLKKAIHAFVRACIQLELIKEDRDVDS